MPLVKRKLGRQGLEVSCLGLGCMGMRQSYGAADEAESLATIDRALELGVTFLDTADLEENLAAADLALSPAELAALDAALPPDAVAGPRYDEERMRTVDR